MDNTRTLPGYKYFVDPRDGGRPPVYVAFLDLADDAAQTVSGFCSPVDPEQLAALDRRERNYERIEVTERIAEPRGRTWAYLGTSAGRARMRQGLSAGSAVVARSYLAAVVEAFGRLGEGALERFAASTAPPPCPLRDLERVDVPAPAEPQNRRAPTRHDSPIRPNTPRNLGASE